jgi:hypothetical protein
MKLNRAISTITRPDNTTAYALHDVIATTETAGDVVPLEFSNLGNTFAGNGYITQAKLWVTGAAFATPLRLHLFTEQPSDIGDNAAFPLTISMADTHIGYIDFSVSIVGGSGSDAALFEIDDVRMLIRSKDNNGGNPIFGLLVARDAFTPTSEQVFRVELTCDAYEY